MNTILQPTFDGPAPGRRALSSIGITGRSLAKTIACVCPSGEQQGMEAQDGEVHALEHGVRAGAGVGSIIGVAIAVSAALYLSAATAAFVSVSLVGAGLGAIGGSVAGAILEAGYGLDQGSKLESWGSRVLVTVTDGNDRLPEAEALLVRPAGRMVPRF